MELEMKALHENGMRELVPLPPAKKTIGCKTRLSLIQMVQLNG
jgi:hypothetical protein